MSDAVALPLTSYLLGTAREGGQHRVAFIDLEEATAGDDWGLINRLLATLDRPSSKGNSPSGGLKDRHLLIIDAVEGLETLGGQRDAFGHLRGRRSRIAQILRAAKNKCHVVFIVEEPKENERLPEAFVSDAVIRLRVIHDRDHDRRTVEIEKMRGQAYVRGQHDCMIRRGAGSQTGQQNNPDHLDFILDDQTKAYFLVTHSLQYLSREVMETRLRESDTLQAKDVDPRTTFILKQTIGYCSFGIPYLDEMIGNTNGDPNDNMTDPLGIPWGSITALIGDDGTHKGRFGRAFLAQSFLRAEGFDPMKGVALLLTTHPIDHETLASKFLSHHGKSNGANPGIALKAMADRTFCRRLELHHMSSAILFQIIHSLVQAGLKTLQGSNYPNAGSEIAPTTPAPGRIRLVIDDWSGIQDAYPEIKSDPLFLPFLIFYLKRQGITVLIIDTQPGRLNHILTEESDRELRALVPYHIYTWHVTFIGEKRVAIASMPPIDDKKPFVVRELKPDRGRDEELIVDPHFEYYIGFEEDKIPRAVPLRVRLFKSIADTREKSISSDYLAEVSALLESLYGAGEAGKVVDPVNSTEYDLYRDFAYLQGKSALEHSLQRVTSARHTI